MFRLFVTTAMKPLSRVFTYSATKAAVHNLSGNLAREWAADRLPGKLDERIGAAPSDLLGDGLHQRTRDSHARGCDEV